MRTSFTIVFLMVVSALWAQSESALIRKGNISYAEEDYNAAAEWYYRALDKNKNNPKAYFNLGDAQYRKGEMEAARSSYMRAGEESNDADIKSRAWHNIGNTYLHEENYSQAAEAFKKSLIHNPTDEETRHNLAYAQRMLKKQQSQQQQDQSDQRDQNSDGDQKSENSGDSKEGNNQNDSSQSDQSQGDQQNENSEKEQSGESSGSSGSESEQSEEGNPGEKGGMSREEAERLLRAIENQERAVQGKVIEKKSKGSTSETERDW